MHELARNDAIGAAALPRPVRKELLRWVLPGDLPADPAAALPKIVAEFADAVKRAGAADEVAAQYQRKAQHFHDWLPQVLARTEIVPTYGAEQEVIRRVYDRLEQRYELQRSVIENALFRNMRGFIYDISKQPGRRFDQAEFETELRSVWPQMIPIRDVPPLDSDHIDRPDLAHQFTMGWTGRVVEAVGISGSGKTMLAAEVIKLLHVTDPDRLAYYAEVRPAVRLREVLAGVAFCLRRVGISEPFAVSVQAGPTDDEVLMRLARSFSAMPREILLVMDLVEGTCSPAFARDLATFTYCRMQATTPLNDKYVFTLYTKATPTQARAFELLGINPDRTQ